MSTAVTHSVPPKNNSWVLLSYLAILLIGLPFWVHTTWTERLSLPANQVLAWSMRLPCPVALNTQFQLEHPVQDALRWNDTELHDVPRLSSNCIGFTASEGLDALSLDLDVSQKRPQFDGHRLVVPSITLASLAPVTRLVRSISNAEPRDPDQVVKYAPKYKLVFSLFYQDASSEPSLTPGLDLLPHLAQHIHPLLRQLQGIHNFSIETQTQYYAPLSVPVQQTGDGGVIHSDQLKAFINRAEWNLAASGASDPTLHFIAFLPSPHLRPLRSINDNGLFSTRVAFAVPQFGSVYVLDASPELALSSAFASFRTQLESLLGLPQPPQDLDMPLAVRSEWQRRLLAKRHVIANAREAVETLQAIIKLTKEQSQMRIGKEVQGHTQQALDAIEQCQTEKDLAKLLQHAVSASSHASKAFFHPSMLGLLYFPQEHKYAVYTPLFGPVAVPLLSAAVREWLGWRRSRQKRAFKQD